MTRYRQLTGSLLISAMILTGCANPHHGDARAGADSDVIAPVSPDHTRIQYYIDRLPDRDYVETYGGPENPRPWYTAAEALGEIGKPAIPALISRLETSDSHELMLALYALMLASQDPVLQTETGGDYLRLSTVLTPGTNAENRQRALEWWQRYQHLWR